MLFSSLYPYNELSNLDLSLYVILSTYITSLFLIGANVFNIKKMYSNGKKWITYKL